MMLLTCCVLQWLYCGHIRLGEVGRKLYSWDRVCDAYLLRTGNTVVLWLRIAHGRSMDAAHLCCRQMQPRHMLHWTRRLERCVLAYIAHDIRSFSRMVAPVPKQLAGGSLADLVLDQVWTHQSRRAHFPAHGTTERQRNCDT
jgi:hypothetical protein